jgi:hypothetical protein
MEANASPNQPRTRRKLRFAGFAAAAVVLAALAAVTLACDSPRASRSEEAERQCSNFGGGPQKQIATARLIIENNATDKDMGVHGAFDDDGWSRLCVFDRSGRPILHVGPKSQLKELTMAGIFFESREPPIRELSFGDLKRKFPEGRYAVRGVTHDGKRLVGSALFTHDVPRKPPITAPGDEATVARDNAVVRWRDVTETIDGRPVNITGYQVIVTKEQKDDPHGFSRPIYDVHVPRSRNSLKIPPEFLQPGSEYELEVLALEKSGNQTINVRFFSTR